MLINHGITESGLLSTSCIAIYVAYGIHVRNYFWIIPFLAFLGGYWYASRYVQGNRITIPALLGLDIYQACAILAKVQLHPRLLEEKLDADVPAGTILAQIPMPGMPAKSGQTVSLVVSKQPERIQAPMLVGNYEETIDQQVRSYAVRLKAYRITSTYPKGMCVGQWPSPGTILEEPKMIVYYASGQEVPVMVPNLRGIQLQEVVDFCRLHGLPKPHIRSQSNSVLSDQAPVIDQHPVPGSLLEPSKISFHVLVS